MKMAEVSAELLEKRMRLAEKMLEKAGAGPLESNQKNREILNQRQTYLYENTYYRIDHAAFDGEVFLIVSCIDIETYAAIGLMEDVEAIPLDASESRIEASVRHALGIADG